MADMRRAKRKGKSFNSRRDFHLPLDILMNHVWVRLPLKCLLRLRGVCKRWLQSLPHSEITRLLLKPHFHHHHKIICGPVYSDMVPQPKSTWFNGAFYSISIHVEESASVSVSPLPGFSIFDTDSYVIIRTLGHSHGMICLELFALAMVGLNDTEGTHLLFGNPSTGSYNIFTHPIGYFQTPLIIGFGYHSLVQDFKLVLVDNSTGNPHIFSLEKNSWTINFHSSYNSYIASRDCHGDIQDNIGYFVTESIYWLVLSSEKNKIVSFDFTDEAFRELELPRPKMLGHISLNVVGGGFLCVSNFHNGNVLLSILFKEEEDNNNINKYHWIDLISVSLCFTNFRGFSRIYPMCFVKDGKILCCLEHGRKKGIFDQNLHYVLIDPQGYTLETGITDYCNFFTGHTFGVHHSGNIDSLVSLN